MNKQAKNFNQALLAAMDTYAEQTCFQAKQSGYYHNISYQQFQTLTFRMARFFGNRGIVNGERVAIVANNSPVWIAAYMACLLSGGVAVPLHVSLSPTTLHLISLAGHIGHIASCEEFRISKAHQRVSSKSRIKISLFLFLITKEHEALSP